ncbi:MAG TPA: hypothetical protein VE090_01580 [Methylomirabilota bacterium]|nr:hypothetical protein [Methylomirabilota bacterium]
MKNYRLFTLISGFVILVTAFILFRSFVTAQSAGQGLEVSPPSQEVTVDPGKTTVIKAKLRNRGNSTLPIQVHVEDFTAKGNEGQIELIANSPYSIASWAKVSSSTFQLGPGEEKEITATITVPQNAAGGHFGSFVFGIQPDKVTKGNGASLSEEIASLFLVRVSGPVTEKLTLKDFSTPNYSEFGPVPFKLTFANNGNIYVKTYGLINVTDMFGKKVADIVVPGVNVFPQAERVVTSSLNKRFLIGSYTATALMYYGSQTQSINATTTFFVFPTRIVGGILIVLLLLFLMRKRFKKAGKALFEK